MSTQTDDETALPFVAPCNQLDSFVAFKWLKLGWQDFKSAPIVSLSYGAIFLMLSYAVTMAAWQWGGAILLFTLLSGFVFLAPVLALGLYSISYQIQSGKVPKLSFSFREGKRHISNIAVFSFVLLIIFLVWARAGAAVHIFAPINLDAKLESYLVFLTIGSAVGSVFAFIVFCVSAFSLPMMLDRKADAITAAITSFNAVMKNKFPLVIWALTIGVCTVICLVTGFLAMLVVMPVLGYASWHGYKQTINAEQWPKNEKLRERNLNKK